VALAHFKSAVTRLRLGAATAAGAKIGLIDHPRWHVTLAFLGDLLEERVPDAESALVAGAAAYGAGDRAAPRLRLAGGGRFGRRRFTVLWVGLAGDTEALASLGWAVREALRRRRVPFDGKPLRPHLTFARPGGRVSEEDLAADLEALGRYKGPDWTVGEIHLVRSHLGQAPVHEPLAAVPLARPA
jgi:2'-5' RNA ligase